MAGTTALVLFPDLSTNWTERYINFIKECEIPATVESRNGPYDVNKYSDKAMKIFQRMIEKEGVKYPILVASTKLYYKTHRQFVNKIGNYISDGVWRSDYAALLSSAGEGEAAIHEHITQEINKGTEFSKFKMG